MCKLPAGNVVSYREWCGMVWGVLTTCMQGSSEAGVISHSQNEDFSTFQISKLSGLQFTSLNLRISHKYGFRVVTQSQIQFGTDSENSIFALFWLDGPSN